MDSNFKLEVLTPTREFLSAIVEAVTFTATDGEMTVLKGHAPMIATLDVGELKIKENGEWRSAFHSEGFVEVRPDEVLFFSQACEWPEEIDVARAEKAKEHSIEQMRQRQSLYEHKRSGISLTRAMTRLKVSSKR